MKQAMWVERKGNIQTTTIYLDNGHLQNINS